MHIKVLGCSGAIASGCRTTSFLLDDCALIDAGTGVGDLSLEQLARIDDILISHSHLDHILSIGLLADSVLRIRAAEGRPPIAIHALPETLAALRAHIFNGVIWPDFTCLPSTAAPVLALREFAIGDRFLLSHGQRVEVLSAVHTVPAVGFAIDRPGADGESERGHWVFTGDTAPNAALWQRLATLRVAHLVIETAFGDDEHELARISRHLCPAELQSELRHLTGRVDVHITHIKPGETSAVMAEIACFNTPHRIRALQIGDEMSL